MTWSYSQDPVNSSVDWVRWKLGLTDSSRQIVQDEEIASELNDQSNRYLAAAEVADAVAGIFARDVDFDYEHIAEDASQAQAHFQTLADRLRDRGQTLFGDPEPIFESENEGIEEDGDPLFHQGEMDNA